ncbi:MAG: hypothetical protein IIW48_04825 [Clostridia bacterium]|nr:hypothetical protein [Clostridia bacterium]
MKNRVIIKRKDENIRFYLKNDKGEFWLFDQQYTDALFDYFKNGRSEKEIITFRKWGYDKDVVKAVCRIPREIKYVTKYIIEDPYAA